MKIAASKNTKNETRINEDIRGYDECRVIGADGVQLGVMSLSEALSQADAAELDLVEVSPQANPPVVRIMDFGKYKYDQQKRDKNRRKNSKTVETKEIKFRVNIDKGDYNTKINHIRKFLSKGHRVKITIMFRGREIAHANMGLDILEQVAIDVEDIASITQAPKTENRNMSMLLSPNSQIK